MPTKVKRRYRTIAEKARKYYLPSLLQRFDHKCYWCKEQIIMRRSIQKESIIEEKHGVVTFFSDGVPKQVRLASVDHLQTLASGGTNQTDNLVPACWFCNNDRSNRKG